MSRRTMQRFNTIKDQFLALVNPNAENQVNFKQIFGKWEEDGAIQYIINEMPEELDKIIDIEYTRTNTITMMDENTRYTSSRPIICTLLESYIVFAVDKNMYDAVSFVFSHYAQYIRHRVYTECIFKSLDDAHYKIFNYMTTDKNIVKHHKLNYVNLFITISRRIIFDLSSNECIGKSIRHIIRALMRNSHKVPFSYFIQMISCYTNLDIHTFRYMLKNVKGYVIEPYDFNLEDWGYSDDKYNLFINMVKRGHTDYAMVFVDELCEYNINVVHRNMENMYNIINENFTYWDKKTNVKFVEWYYFKTNKQFNIIDYVNSRVPYEIYTTWYEWALHLRQLLILIRKYYGKRIAINFASYNDIRWCWFESANEPTPNEMPYYEKHCKYAKHLFSYGCIKMVDKVKMHAKFLI